MIPNQVGVEAVVSGDMETAKAKIKMSAHMVDLLSSRVYTDKIAAVVRELSCNAHDAQVAAGINLPIEVHLPTKFEPYFEVKDNGTGLSHEDVMDLYVTYGESTKQDSNDAVGFMGIGSKSPFSYADAFTTTSIFKGVKRVYSIFKNNGIPEVVLLSEAKSTEPNGLAVKVSVKEGDFNNFEVTARKIFFYFDKLPKCNKELESYYEKLDINKDDFFTLPNEYHNRVSCVMGQVNYSLPDSRELTELKNLINKTLVLKFNIGDVQPAASREHLSNDERTENIVKDKLRKIIDEYKADVVEEAQKFSDPRSAYSYIHSAFNTRNDQEVLSLKYKSRHFSAWENDINLGVDTINDKFTGTIYQRESYWGSTAVNKITSINKNKIGFRGYDVVFLIKDIKVGGLTSFKEKLSGGNIGFVVEDQQTIDWICSKLCFSVINVKIYKASEIHVKEVKEKVKHRVGIIKEVSGRVDRTFVEDLDLNSIKKPVAFVVANRDGYRDHNGTYQNSIQSLRQLVRQNIFSTIFVIPSILLAKVDNKNLVQLSPELIERKITKEMIRNRAANHFNAYKLEKPLYEVFKSTNHISDKYENLNKLAGKYNRSLDMELDELMSFISSTSKVTKLIERACRIAKGISKVKDKLSIEYKFLNNFKNIDEESIKYISYLVKAQDSGKL